MKILMILGMGSNVDPERVSQEVKIPLLPANTSMSKAPNFLAVYDCGKEVPTEGWDEVLVFGKCNVGELKSTQVILGDDQTKQAIDFINVPSEMEGEDE